MGNWSIESELGRSIAYGSLSGLATSVIAFVKLLTFVGISVLSFFNHWTG